MEDPIDERQADAGDTRDRIVGVGSADARRVGLGAEECEPGRLRRAELEDATETGCGAQQPCGVGGFTRRNARWVFEVDQHAEDVGVRFGHRAAPLQRVGATRKQLQCAGLRHSATRITTQ